MKLKQYLKNQMYVTYFYLLIWFTLEVDGKLIQQRYLLRMMNEWINEYVIKLK